MAQFEVGKWYQYIHPAGSGDRVSGVHKGPSFASDGTMDWMYTEPFLCLDIKYEPTKMQRLSGSKERWFVSIEDFKEVPDPRIVKGGLNLSDPNKPLKGDYFENPRDGEIILVNEDSVSDGITYVFIATNVNGRGNVDKGNKKLYYILKEGSIWRKIPYKEPSSETKMEVGKYYKYNGKTNSRGWVPNMAPIKKGKIGKLIDCKLSGLSGYDVFNFEVDGQPTGMYQYTLDLFDEVPAPQDIQPEEMITFVKDSLLRDKRDGEVCRVLETTKDPKFAKEIPIKAVVVMESSDPSWAKRRPIGYIVETGNFIIENWEQISLLSKPWNIIEDVKQVFSPTPYPKEKTMIKIEEEENVIVKWDNGKTIQI